MKRLCLLFLFNALCASSHVDYQTEVNYQDVVVDIMKSNRKRTILSLKQRLVIVDDDLNEAEFLLTQSNPNDELRKIADVLRDDKINLELIIRCMQNK